jgi:hypothetical protein
LSAKLEVLKIPRVDIEKLLREEKPRRAKLKEREKGNLDR